MSELLVLQIREFEGFYICKCPFCKKYFFTRYMPIQFLQNKTRCPHCSNIVTFGNIKND